MKNSKKLLVSIFILIFNSAWLLNILTSSATSSATSSPFINAKPVDSFAYALYTQRYPEHGDLSSRLLNYCSISEESLVELSGVELRRCYTSMCQNLPYLIYSQSDYEKMHKILNEIAFHLFGRNLSQKLFIEDYYKEFINLYENAINECVSGDFTFEKKNLNLFDAIFVYSYILHLDKSNPTKEYLHPIRQILIKNGIGPESFCF